MIALRSILFNIAFYANLILRMIVLSPIYFLLPRKKAFFVPKDWARANHWLMEKIVGTTFTVEGLENIPKSGGYILADPLRQEQFEIAEEELEEGYPEEAAEALEEDDARERTEA